MQQGGITLVKSRHHCQLRNFRYAAQFLWMMRIAFNCCCLFRKALDTETWQCIILQIQLPDVLQRQRSACETRLFPSHVNVGGDPINQLGHWLVAASSPNQHSPYLLARQPLEYAWNCTMMSVSFRSLSSSRWASTPARKKILLCPIL